MCFDDRSHVVDQVEVEHDAAIVDQLVEAPQQELRCRTAAAICCGWRARPRRPACNIQPAGGCRLHASSASGRPRPRAPCAASPSASSAWRRRGPSAPPAAARVAAFSKALGSACAAACAAVSRYWSRCGTGQPWRGPRMWFQPWRSKLTFQPDISPPSNEPVGDDCRGAGFPRQPHRHRTVVDGPGGAQDLGVRVLEIAVGAGLLEVGGAARFEVN